MMREMSGLEAYRQLNDGERMRCRLQGLAEVLSAAELVPLTPEENVQDRKMQTGSVGATVQLASPGFYTLEVVEESVRVISNRMPVGTD